MNATHDNRSFLFATCFMYVSGVRVHARVRGQGSRTWGCFGTHIHGKIRSFNAASNNKETTAERGNYQNENIRCKSDE